MTKGHLTATRILAAKIYSVLPENLKAEVDLPILQQAAMLHDYGKVLIPKEILNKKEALTPEEKKIIELHSEFGYELLKQQGVNEKVLKLIKYHHQKPDKSGYPVAENDFEYDINSQILETADIYTALIEERPYHKSYSKEDALDVVYKNVEAGVISKEIFEALKKSV